jgi:HSP20 family protein
MTVLTRWNPAGNLATFEIDRLNRMFDSLFSGEPLSGGWVPAVDIFENANQDVVLKAELPGFTRDAIKVTFEHNTLTIEGERQLDAAITRDKFHQTERQYGAFRRTFALPASVDSAQAQASYQDGVLTITLPRREETKPRQIQVNG